MLKTTTALATILMLSSAPAMVNADEMKAKTTTNTQAAMTVKTLPKDGASVSLDGTVASVNKNKKDFVLRDISGSTIDVESEQEISLNKGDKVSVDGKVDSEFLGLSKEIDATSIRITERASENIAANDNSKSSGNIFTDAKNATTGAVAGAGSAIGNAANSVSNTASNAANSVRERANNMMDPSKEWHGGEYGSIDKLPESGQVMIEAEVSSVSDDMKRFVIKDKTGETIDVNSSVAVNVREGDMVKVKGEMRDEFAGMGEEINAYEVSVNRK